MERVGVSVGAGVFAAILVSADGGSGVAAVVEGGTSVGIVAAMGGELALDGCALGAAVDPDGRAATVRVVDSG